MNSHLEQIQTGLWHDVLRHRIVVAEQLISKYQTDRSPEKSRLVTQLRLDIAKTREKLSS